MERAGHPSPRPGTSLAAVLALSATVLVAPEQAPTHEAGTPPVADYPAAPDETAPPATVPGAVVSWPVSRVSPGTSTVSGPRSTLSGLPARVWLAYTRAAAHFAVARPDCRLPATLLAAIGRVESGHARGGRVDSRGTTLTPIIGPRLDGGPGLAAIPDTDGGGYDRDPVWDHAVGPMQFIPATWRRWASDGNGDGVADPHNVDDAARTAGGYLCADGRDLSTEDGLRAGVLSYNRSESYLRIVLRWMAVYERGIVLGPVAPFDPVAAPVTGPGRSGPDSAPGAPGSGPEPEPGQEPGAPPAAPPSAEPGSPTTPPGGPSTPAPSPSPSPSPSPPPDEAVTDLVDTTVCVVDGIVVSVVTTTTSLLTGLLGGQVSREPAEGCPPPS
ncbi:lytic murein transglycosylase [Actinophytocola sp. NPDC049390]|uniref:lytic transglycosylase domain-containing protein n=1 Tax=Actinophytocola sp. NPDC049390 TaxID=3363894 RepID=UPI0037924581